MATPKKAPTREKPAEPVKVPDEMNDSPDTEQEEAKTYEVEIEELRAQLEKERAEFEEAKEAFEKAQARGQGAQGHGVKLAPNALEVNRIRDLFLAGGNPSGISQILRIDIVAVANHVENFIAMGLKPTGQAPIDPANLRGAKPGMPGGEE